MEKQKVYPFVSVIVPNLDQRYRLLKCIQALQEQNYGKDMYEIIVVDNGSKDGSKEAIKNLSVRLLEENEIKSPYACRNKGISHASGEIIILVDSKCIPDRNWLISGVEAIMKKEGHIITGNIEFEFTKNPSGFE